MGPVLISSVLTTEAVRRGSRSNSGTGPQPWVTTTKGSSRVGIPPYRSVEPISVENCGKGSVGH
jgi:hypothetical protein